MSSESHDNSVQTLHWKGGIDGVLVLIDQTLLPAEFLEITLTDLKAVWEAIKQLRVRGAPAIGIAAAYGVCIGMQTSLTSEPAQFHHRLTEVADYLATSRPTAVNLFWALDRMKAVAASQDSHASPAQVAEALLAEARKIESEDRQSCRAIGQYGAELLESGWGVLTHCNAGGLATADYGTALAVFFAAIEAGKKLHVYADETRPLLQGARLTAWELQRRNIESTLICDSTAAQVMKEGRVQAVVTGADRIASNGDSANKIGTYSLAVLADYHRIPFYIAAPASTFDLSLSSGADIPIEQRHESEITEGFGRRTAPTGVDVYNPAFDVTPASLITGIITDRGVMMRPDSQGIQNCLDSGR